jgi:hypothetical protein
MIKGGPVTDDTDLLQIIIHGATAFELLRTALEFEVFGRLDKAGGMTTAELSEALGADEQPVRVLLLGLAALRLVRREGEEYVNTAVTRRSLLPARPSYVGPLVEFQEKITNPGLPDLAASIRGHTNVGLRHIDGPGTTLYERLAVHPELRHAYYTHMSQVSRRSFPLVVERFDFSGHRHVLDLGGGDGANAIALAAGNPGLEVTVFDHETVVAIAARNAAEAGLSGRVHTLPGDLFADPFPGDADGILLSHLFESWSMERNVELMRKCHAALPDDGSIFVYDLVSEDDNTGPLAAAFMSAYFLTVASGEGMVYAPRDIERALHAAGFTQVERHRGVGFGHALITGRKS